MMKKLFTLLVLLVGGLTGVQADELNVAGINVDLTKSGYVTGSGISGKVYYNHTEKRLDLTDATISAPAGYPGISADVSPGSMDFRIYLTGTNTITTVDKVSIRVDKNVMFCGDGTLNITGHEISTFGNPTITVYACRLKVETTADNAIRGNAEYGGFKLVVRNYGALWLKSKSKVVSDMNSLTRLNDAVVLSGSETGKELMIGNDYRLWIGGKKVTPFNRDNFKEDVVTAGTVSLALSSTFEPTLTLKNATINASAGPIIDYRSSKNLTIKLTGSSTASNNGSYRGLDFGTTTGGPVTIKGSSLSDKLTVTRASYGCVSRNTLTVKDCTLDLTSTFGMTFQNVGSLTVDNAKLHSKASASSGYAVQELPSVKYLNGCMETQPSYAYYNTSKSGIIDDNGLVKEVTIEPTYGVMVCGQMLTKAMGSSAFAVTGKGISGSVTYLPTENVLVLNNAKLQYCGYRGSDVGNIMVFECNGDQSITGSDFPEFSIRVDGSNEINDKESEYAGAAVWSENHLYFYGSGRLNMNSNSGIKVYGTEKWIDFHMGAGGELIDESYNRGIYGLKDDLKLIFSENGATYRFKGVANNCMVGIGSVKMGSYAVQAPMGATFNSSLKTFAKSGTAVKNEWLVFGSTATDYGLEIGGKKVTSINANDPLGDGAFTYNNTTKTLDVNESSTPGGINAITNKEVANLIINFKKTLTLKGGGGGGAIVAHKATTVTSSSTGLITLSAGNTGINAVQGATVTISGVSMQIKDASFGLNGHSGSANLIVKSSYIDIVSTSSAIRGFTGITLDNCYYASPVGAQYKNGYLMESNGTTIAKKATIAVGASAIGDVLTDSDANAEITGIYDAQGRQLQEMQPGVNILRMSNGTTKKVIKK